MKRSRKKVENVIKFKRICISAWESANFSKGYAIGLDKYKGKESLSRPAMGSQV